MSANSDHHDLHDSLDAREQEHDRSRPDFEGFAASLRAEARWSATIHADDKTGQAASDQRALLRLAEHVEQVGRHQGFLPPKRT